MDQLEKHYFEQARQGVVLTTPQLREYAQRMGLSSRVTNAQLESLKSLWEVTSVHAQKRSPGGFVGSQILKMGCIFADVAEYKKNLRVANGGRCYMLVGVDGLTEKLSVVAMANKTQASWEAGIMYMVEHVFPVVTTIVVDRDVAIAGKAFQARMKRDHNIDFFHLRVRSKSYKAEIQIRNIKRKLSVGLAMNRKGDNRWLDKLPAIVAHHNSQFVKGTKIRREDAVQGNMMELLAQKFKTPEFGVYFNNAVISQFSAKMRKGLGFKYAPGQKVLLTRAATYEAGEGKAAKFDKISVEGTFNRQVYEIEKAMLKDNSSHTLNFVYQLKDLAGIYYQHELTPASFVDRKKKVWELGEAAVRDQEGLAASRRKSKRRRQRRQQEA
jgi:hypothetical protein